MLRDKETDDENRLESTNEKRGGREFSLMTNRSLTAIPLVPLNLEGIDITGGKSLSYSNRGGGVSFRTLINIIQTEPLRAPVNSRAKGRPRRVPMSYRLFIERSI